MGKFYANKILKGEINPKTDKAWTIDDVPKLWKAATQKYIDEVTPKEEDQPEA